MAELAQGTHYVDQIGGLHGLVGERTVRERVQMLLDHFFLVEVARLGREDWPTQWLAGQ